MEKDLNFGIKIIGVPIVREKDGLAMSSRNTYLSETERKEALNIYKSLKQAKELVEKGERVSKVLMDNAMENILSYKDAKIDYINICNPETLEDVDLIEGPVLMAVAVFMGKTRLIDNIVINPS
jgi:pantoate--beta-alanine ligase